MAAANDHRWVVTFAGARDSYQVPIALHEAGLLETLVTDFYAPLDRGVFASDSGLLPSPLLTKIAKRFDPALPSTFVQSHFDYAIKHWWDPESWMDRVGSLGERAGRIAARQNCSILAYAHVATNAFSTAGAGRRVLMQMQPHPAAVKASLLSDRFAPEFQDQIRNEVNWPQEVSERFSREPHLADLCIAASNYTRRTLIENGLSSDRVSVIPYGVDVEFFCPADFHEKKFSVLFVAQLCRQKGLHYLLEAWRQLALPNAELRIVGLTRDKAVISRYAQVARFLGPLNWLELREEYRRTDLLCLPSLSDGFGQVVLEALTCGTPVLTTTSCGASDLIVHEHNGFVIPAADLDSMIATLTSASYLRDRLREMRASARATAEEYPGTRFRRSLVEKLRSITGDA